MSGRSFLRRRAAQGFGLAAVLAGAACAPGNGQGSRALYELERLAFVPAARASIPGIYDEHADCSIERAIVMDLFEFSQRDGEYYRFDGGGRRSEFTTDGATQHMESWPLYLDFYEAEELARARGMRLPTAKEWIHVATGGGTQLYPWHAVIFQHGVANTLNLDVGRPTPVGTFERGRSAAYGCYDLYGNLWEWVIDVVPGYTDVKSFDNIGTDDRARFVFLGPERDPETGEPSESSVLGGSYLTASSTEKKKAPLFELRKVGNGVRVFFLAQRTPRGLLSPTIGARMCADAEEYLWATASAWGRSSEDQRRIRATGQRWASTSGREVMASFLDELAARDQAPPALQWLAEGARE